MQLTQAKTRRRAPRACRLCRYRKVRCVTVDSSQQCVNCQLDGTSCDLIRTCQPTTASTLKSSRPFNEPPPRRRRPSDNVHSISGASKPISSPAFSTTHQSSGYYIPSATSTADESSTLRTAKSSAHQQLRDEATGPVYPSYSFLQAPTIRSIFDQDREFLIAQGCFTLPQRSILDEFIRHYFLHVHPMLPMLNEAEFWAAYDGKRPHNETAGKVPMLVMQAILFVCASFVSSSAVSALGFKDAHAAKTAFYRRAKLLYDFNCEPSPVAIAQAAILLSHSHLTPLDHTESARLGSMWLNIAIFQAREAKADQYQSIPAVGCQQSADQVSSRNCLKRLWWCCIIRDRVMPLTSRRHINIDHSNFDFGCSPPLGQSDVAEEIHMSKVYTAATKSFLSDILVELVKLCVVLTDILTMVSALQHSSRPFFPRVNAEIDNIMECKSALRQWQTTAQCSKAKLDSQEAQDAAPSAAARDSLTLFTRLLDLYYYSAMTTLCHYEMMHFNTVATSLGLDYQDWTLDENDNQVEEALRQVSECLEELVRLRLAQWLPLSVIGCAAFPLALQALDTKLRQDAWTSWIPSDSTTPSGRGNQPQIDVLVQVIEACRPRHTAVEWVIKAVKCNVTTTYESFRARQIRSGDSQTLTSWTQILRLKPRQYLCLVTAMDFSISKGKLPGKWDLPVSLDDISAGPVFGAGIPVTPCLGLLSGWGPKGLTFVPLEPGDGKQDASLGAQHVPNGDSMGELEGLAISEPGFEYGRDAYAETGLNPDAGKHQSLSECHAETPTPCDGSSMAHLASERQPRLSLGNSHREIVDANGSISLDIAHENQFANGTEEVDIISPSQIDPVHWGDAVMHGSITSLGLGLDYAIFEELRKTIGRN